MNRVTELIPYEPAYASQTVQAYLEVFTAPPWNEALSLNDALSQLETDSQREGFGGILARTGQEIGGFSWWFDMSGPELNDRWRLRFAPKEKIPHLEGRGVYLMEFGILPTLRHHGLGKKILDATLEQIEPNHDWIALNTSNIAHAGLALLKSRAFEDLGLKGIQVPTRICLVKWTHP